MKILITNSVPLNGGDQALLQATVKGLRAILPKDDLDLTILCSDPANCAKYLPEYRFDWDYERTIFHYSYTLKEKIKHLFRKLTRRASSRESLFNPNMLLASKAQRRVYRLYQEADLIISSPGGYLHDFYNYEDRARVFQLAFQLDKPVVLLAQSIGPFWKSAQLPLLKEVLLKMTAIILREKYSFAHFKSLELESDRVKVTTDVAFALHHFIPNLYTPKKDKPLKKVAMVFRPWKDAPATSEILQKAVALCTYLLDQYAIAITFLSTCQGIKDYHDDSIFAKKILASLKPKHQASCAIDAEYHDYLSLIKAYGKFDAYIGMRLHGAIFSMLGGTPAMNIGYEDKTKGIYQFLSLADYQLSYTESAENWQELADHFFTKLPDIQKQLPAILDRAATNAVDSFMPIEKIIKPIISSKLSFNG